MLVLIQRVSQAAVHVDDEAVGQIGPGLLALVGMEPGDTEAQLQRMAERGYTKRQVRRLVDWYMRVNKAG